MLYLLKTELNSEIHRIWFKNILNPVFRIVQFWTNRPCVIVSKVEECKVVGYGFRRKKLLK